MDPIIPTDEIKIGTVCEHLMNLYKVMDEKNTDSEKLSFEQYYVKT